MLKPFGRITMLATLLIVASMSVRGAVIVTLDTSSIPNSGQTWFLDFELAQGTNALANTVTVSGITIAGGGYTGPDILAGGATGAFPNYTLTNSSLSNRVSAPFLMGSQIRFLLDYTTNFDGSLLQDTFTWTVSDGAPGNTIVDSGLGALLVVLLEGGQPLSVYESSAAYGAVQPNLSLPDQVPEPRTASLMLLAAAALFAIRLCR